MERTIRISEAGDTPRRITDDEYDVCRNCWVRLCLDFMIVQPGKILLAKRKIEPFLGYWSLVGGMRRRKEDIENAMHRILMFELGVGAKSTQFSGYIDYPNDGPVLHSFALVFLTVLEEGKIFGSEQATEIEWFSEIPEGVHPLQESFLREHWVRALNWGWCN